MYDETIQMDQLRLRLHLELATVTPPGDLLENVVAKLTRKRRTQRLLTGAGAVVIVAAIALPLSGMGSPAGGRMNRSESIVLAGVRVNLPHDLRSTPGPCNLNSAETVWRGNGGHLGPSSQIPLPPVEVAGVRESPGAQEMTTPTGSYVCVATWLFGPYHLRPGMSLSSPFVSEIPGRPSTRTSGSSPTPFDGSEALFGGSVLVGYKVGNKEFHLHILVEDVIARIPKANGEVDLLMAQGTGISQSDFKSIVGQIIGGV
jgi:hypothetical protein